MPFQDYIDNSIVLIDTVGDAGDLKEKAVTIVDLNKVKKVTDPKKLAAIANPTDIQKNLKNIQIETCRKQNLRFCPVMKTSSMSTGFFEEGKKLNSCRHAFHNWLVWASQANGNIPVETLSPPMILYSKEYTVLYNSALVPTEQLLKFSFLNTDPRINILDFEQPNPITNDWMNLQLSDVAQFESQVELVEPQAVVYDANINKFKSESPSTQLDTRVKQIISVMAKVMLPEVNWWLLWGELHFDLLRK